MENSIIAYCGLDCSKCDAYQATQAGDPEVLEQVAAGWREQFDPSLTAEAIRCDGCLATDGPLCSYCAECPIRACGIDRGVQNCAQCPDYGCEIIQNFFTHAPEMAAVLDKMRAEWQASRG